MNTITSPIARFRRGLIDHWPGFGSQERTAKRLRISVIHYAHIESGRAGCSDALARKIARMYKRYDEKFTVEKLEQMMKRARRGYLERQMNGNGRH